MTTDHTTPNVTGSATGLKGRSVFITGGASGIGRAVALHAAKGGARVTIADLDETKGSEVVREIEHFGGEAMFARCDVTDEAQIREAVNATKARFGALHAACNGAGMVFMGVRVHEIPVDFWDKVTAVNLRGTFLCMKYELEAMLEAGGGAIVNIASTAAVASFKNSAEYCATKAGIAGLTRSGALDYADANIRVNAVMPGSTRTPMLEKGMGQIEGMEAMMASMIPMGRLGEPDDIAMTICWMLSDEARYVTGILLPVDGGMTASL
jgi:2,5-dichloro-2,5-cyclohexadiene-1,4-diol dehydrogenase 1